MPSMVLHCVDVHVHVHVPFMSCSIHVVYIACVIFCSSRTSMLSSSGNFIHGVSEHSCTCSVHVYTCIVCTCKYGPWSCTCTNVHVH